MDCILEGGMMEGWRGLNGWAVIIVFLLLNCVVWGDLFAISLIGGMG